ncbi:MAG: hypothetical protein KGN01_06515 [Patescibacteria group bacterium]|nr:hypothetical protein [Patescibacteria group bacterium]
MVFIDRRKYYAECDRCQIQIVCRDEKALYKEIGLKNWKLFPHHEKNDWKCYCRVCNIKVEEMERERAENMFSGVEEPIEIIDPEGFVEEREVGGVRQRYVRYS